MAMSSIVVKSFQMSALTVALALAGCGGGGNNDTIAPPTTGGGNGNGGSGGSTTNNPVNSSSIQLLDANGNATTTISAAGATAKVTITDASGKGISGALVTFSGDGVTFGTTNGAVLTNADGVATISVKPTDATDTGSYQLSATATYGSNSATTAAYNFSLQAANTSITNMTAGSANLASGASTNVTLTTMDATTNTAQNNVGVTFTTTCGTFTTSSVTSSNQGNVTTTYKAIDVNGNLCEGAQTITATTSTGVSKSIQISVAAIKANSIVYTTSSNVALVTKGSGSANSGTVEFTVYSNGIPASNQSVNINLLKSPSDLSLSSTSLARQITLVSDSSGKVTVQLYPGTIPGPVEVNATLASDTSVTTVSKNVSVATGRVYQNGLSISASKYSLQNYTDGDSSTIVARMTDRVGNPVPDGTVISFVTEGGSITPSCASVGGSCEVTLTVQNPRPSNGRVTVLAYVEGDKAYIDANGNNMWDTGEAFINNIGDFFRDDNENNAYDLGEFKFTRGESGNVCATSTFFQPNLDGTCGTGLSAIIRQQKLFTFSGKTPTITVLTDPLPLQTEIKFAIFGNSEMSIPMPSGTTVAFATTDNTKDNNASCTVEMRTGAATVPSSPDSNTPYYTARFKECASGDDFKLTITPSGDQARTYSYTFK